MSGIKDYAYSYTEERRRRLRDALQQFQRRRAAETEARLAEGRRRARERIESAQAARAAAKQAELAGRARETQRSMNAFQTTHADPVPGQGISLARRQETPVAGVHDEKAEKANAVELTDQLADVEAWRETLVTDEAVQTFQASEAQTWANRAEQLFADETGGAAGHDILARAEHLRNEAMAIHEEAGKRRGQFEARNQLLRDIIASLKEIGFFVSDPYYQDSGNPAGPVVLRAVRGSEEMTASVDLSETVSSVWNGLEAEHCKSAFCDYVERMKGRGVEITAKRAELHQRPILRQKGALDLPKRGTERAGG